MQNTSRLPYNGEWVEVVGGRHDGLRGCLKELDRRKGVATLDTPDGQQVVYPLVIVKGTMVKYPVSLVVLFKHEGDSS